MSENESQGDLNHEKPEVTTEGPTEETSNPGPTVGEGEGVCESTPEEVSVHREDPAINETENHQNVDETPSDNQNVEETKCEEESTPLSIISEAKENPPASESKTDSGELVNQLAEALAETHIKGEHTDPKETDDKDATETSPAAQASDSETKSRKKCSVM